MKVLVTGASGGLGRYVVKAFAAEDVLAPTRAELDVTNASNVLDVVCSSGADVVAHLAAVTDVRGCECESVYAVTVNAQGTANVAHACRLTGARMVYASTDAVFSDAGPHAETDVPSPFSVYGWTKFVGEQAVAVLGDRGLVVRANFFTRHCSGKESFAEYVVRNAREGREFPCFSNVMSSPVFAGTLAEQIAQAVARRDHGVLHVASRDAVNRITQAMVICVAYGLPIEFVVSAESSSYDGRLVAERGLCGTVREEVAKMVEGEVL